MDRQRYNDIVSSILNIKKLITSLLFLLKSVADDVNTVTITGLTGEIVDEFDNLLSNLSSNEALDFKISTFNLIKIVIHRIKAKVAKVPFLEIDEFNAKAGQYKFDCKRLEIFIIEVIEHQKKLYGEAHPGETQFQAKSTTMIATSQVVPSKENTQQYMNYLAMQKAHNASLGLPPPLLPMPGAFGSPLRATAPETTTTTTPTTVSTGSPSHSSTSLHSSLGAERERGVGSSTPPSFASLSSNTSPVPSPSQSLNSSAKLPKDSSPSGKPAPINTALTSSENSASSSTATGATPSSPTAHARGRRMTDPFSDASKVVSESKESRDAVSPKPEKLTSALSASAKYQQSSRTSRERGLRRDPTVDSSKSSDTQRKAESRDNLREPPTREPATRANPSTSTESATAASSNPTPQSPNSNAPQPQLPQQAPINPATLKLQSMQRQGTQGDSRTRPQLRPVFIPPIETDLQANEILNIEFPLKFTDGKDVSLALLRAFLFNETTGDSTPLILVRCYNGNVSFEAHPKSVGSFKVVINDLSNEGLALDAINITLVANDSGVVPEGEEPETAAPSETYEGANTSSEDEDLVSAEEDESSFESFDDLLLEENIACLKGIEESLSDEIEQQSKQGNTSGTVGKIPSPKPMEQSKGNTMDRDDEVVQYFDLLMRKKTQNKNNAALYSMRLSDLLKESHEESHAEESDEKKLTTNERERASASANTSHSAHNSSYRGNLSTSSSNVPTLPPTSAAEKPSTSPSINFDAYLQKRKEGKEARDGGDLAQSPGLTRAESSPLHVPSHDSKTGATQREQQQQSTSLSGSFPLPSTAGSPVKSARSVSQASMSPRVRVRTSEGTHRANLSRQNTGPNTHSATNSNPHSPANNQPSANERSNATSNSNNIAAAFQTPPARARMEESNVVKNRKERERPRTELVFSMLQDLERDEVRNNDFYSQLTMIHNIVDGQGDGNQAISESAIDKTINQLSANELDELLLKSKKANKTKAETKGQRTTDLFKFISELELEIDQEQNRKTMRMTPRMSHMSDRDSVLYKIEKARIAFQESELRHNPTSPRKRDSILNMPLDKHGRKVTPSTLFDAPTMAHLLNSMEHSHDLSKSLQPTTGALANSHARGGNNHADTSDAAGNGGGDKNVRYSIMRLPRQSAGGAHWQATKRTGKGKDDVHASKRTKQMMNRLKQQENASPIVFGTQRTRPLKRKTLLTEKYSFRTAVKEFNLDGIEAHLDKQFESLTFESESSSHHVVSRTPSSRQVVAPAPNPDYKPWLDLQKMPHELGVKDLHRTILPDGFPPEPVIVPVKGALSSEQYKVHMVQNMELQKWENNLLLFYRKNGRLSPSWASKKDYQTIDHTSTPPSNSNAASGHLEKIELSLPAHNNNSNSSNNKHADSTPISPRNSNSSKNKDSVSGQRGRVSKSKTAFY